MSDLKFVDALQKRFSNQVGFLPRPAITQYLDAGQVRIIAENGSPAGYILGRPSLAWQPLLRPIFQACIAMDAQRRHLGLMLLKQIEAETIASGQIGIQANCAADIEANEFWKAAGFSLICHLNPSNARGRDIVCWRKPLIRKIPLWFALPPARAGHRAHHATHNQRQRR